MALAAWECGPVRGANLAGKQAGSAPVLSLEMLFLPAVAVALTLLFLPSSLGCATSTQRRGLGLHTAMREMSYLKDNSLDWWADPMPLSQLSIYCFY